MSLVNATVPVVVGSVSVPVLLIVEITGDVSVLFVRVCDPVKVATVPSIAMVTVLVAATDVSIPVPPVKVTVAAEVTVSAVPVLAARSNPENPDV